MEPAVLVDSVRQLLLDLLHVRLPHLRLREVAHHNVAPAETDLPLLPLRGIENIGRPRQLVVLLVEDLHLTPGHGEPAGTPDVAPVGAEGRRKKEEGGRRKEEESIYKPILVLPVGAERRVDEE